MDIVHSGTRREELLLDDETIKRAWLLRRMVSMIASNSANFTEATERVLERPAHTKTNAEFPASLNRENKPNLLTEQRRHSVPVNDRSHAYR